MSNKDIEVYAKAQKRKEREEETKPTRKSTRELTYTRDKSREQLRDLSRGISREYSRDLPTRDEIQGFSFLLRDELKVKVQAELPHHWKDELEEISRRQKVNKLELYRFVFGEFLGKILRKKGNQ